MSESKWMYAMNVCKMNAQFAQSLSTLPAKYGHYNALQNNQQNQPAKYIQSRTVPRNPEYNQETLEKCFQVPWQLLMPSQPNYNSKINDERA